jgi:plasmid stabilization system protein ParE
MESAEADLNEIPGFIAERDGTSRALRVYGKFVEAFEALAVSPRIGVPPSGSRPPPALSPLP